MGCSGDLLDLQKQDPPALCSIKGTEPTAVLGGETPQLGLWERQELPPNPLPLSLLPVSM